MYLILISPAKTLDFTNRNDEFEKTIPVFSKQANEIADELKTLSQGELSKLMKISPKLAKLNYIRHSNFKSNPDMSDGIQAVFAYRGEVYSGLDIDSFTKKEIGEAQDKLRILSGLYGYLKPLDLIQAYRLEMGTKLNVNNTKDLYEFWGTKITDVINKEIEERKIKYVINLASDEYFKAVRHKNINAQIIKPVFHDYKNGQFKVISIYAKKARGLMTSYLLKNKITQIDEIANFDSEGYAFYDESKNFGNVIYRRIAKK